MKYWLMKSEPDVFGIEHLKQQAQQRHHWDGVRNYQARNMMRDQMQVGDLIFFYHSSCAEPGIAGIAEVVKAGYPDHTALDPTSTYFDPKSTAENPRWFMVDVKYQRQFRHIISLKQLKEHALELDGLALLQKGSRLSIMPVTPAQWDYILKLE